MEPPGGLVALLVRPWLSPGVTISYSGISAAEEWHGCPLACLFEVSRVWHAHSTTEIRGDHARAGSLPSLPFRPVPPAPGGDDDGGHNGMESLRGRDAKGKHKIPTVDSETEKHNNGDPVGCLPNGASLPRTARAVCITNMLSQVCRLGDLAIRACWVS